MKYFKKKLFTFWLMLALILPMTTISPAVDTNAATNFQLNVIDVGQGNAVLIRNNGTNTLVDTGLEKAYSQLDSYLSKQGIKKIHNLVITHPDADHMGGADLVIDDYNVNKFYSCNYKATTNEYKEMMNALKRNGITPKYVTEGQKIGMGTEITATVLSPEKGVSYSDPNSASVVLRITKNKKKFLLMGDATAKIENRINSDYNVKTDMLLVSHHGSDSSNGVAFIKEASPKYAAISVGKDNSYGHPDGNVLRRLETYSDKVLRTDLNGNITFKIVDGVLKATTQKTGTNSNIKLNYSKINVKKGSTKQLKVLNTSKSVTWSSSNKSIATVSKGKVKGIKAGTCTIYAKVAGKKLSCKVTVTKNSTSGKIIGNKKSKIYHTRDCGSLPTTNAVRFKSVQAAKNAGYRLCKRCAK